MHRKSCSILPLFTCAHNKTIYFLSITRGVLTVSGMHKCCQDVSNLFFLLCNCFLLLAARIVVLKTSAMVFGVKSIALLILT